MKVYTKTGDTGDTSLFDGVRVSKSNMRIHAYGTVDELNAHIGLLRGLTSDRDRNKELIRIQDRLFTLGALLATKSDDKKKKLPLLSLKDLTHLEEAIDAMDKLLPPLKTFVLPGGHPTVSYCHIARCVCRRAERICVEFSINNKVDTIVVQYLNRLSDYLFVLSRYHAKILKSSEISWLPEKRDD